MDNRRLFLAALLSLGVLLVWQLLFVKPPVRPPEPAAVQGESRPAPEPVAREESSRPPSTSPESEAASPVAVSAEPISAEIEETVEVTVGGVVARLSNRGGQLVSFERRVSPVGTESVEMVRRRASAPYPFAWVDERGDELALNRVLHRVERTQEGADVVVGFRYRGAEGDATKLFRFRPDGLFEVEVSVAGVDPSSWGLLLGPGLRNPGYGFLDDRFQARGAAFGNGDDVDNVVARKTDEPLTRAAGGFRWVGLEDTYFLTALLPERPFERVEIVPRIVLGNEEDGVTGYGDPSADEDGPIDFEMVVVPGREELRARAFFGSKTYDDLVAVDAGLERTVRWGFLRPLARVLQIGVNWIHANVVSNYGWSIVLMTILINLVLLPLRHKSQMSMQKMQKLNPEMEAIRKRYRPKLKDKQGRPNLEMQRKMNEEMQDLFRREGVNPAGGCLPLLLQMPVFFAFYYLLRGAVELWHAPWVLWIQDLSAPDPYWVLPIVMGATQLLQQKLMPPASNPAQRFIMTTFPIWFTVIAIGFPAGLVLYWLTNNVLTIVQQGGYNQLKKAGYFGGPEEPATSGRGPRS